MRQVILVTADLDELFGVVHLMTTTAETAADAAAATPDSMQQRQQVATIVSNSKLWHYSLPAQRTAPVALSEVCSLH